MGYSPPPYQQPPPQPAPPFTPQSVPLTGAPLMGGPMYPPPPNGAPNPIIGILLLLPALIVIVLLFVLPVINAVTLSTQNARGIEGEAQSVGLRNYERILDDPNNWDAALVTLIIFGARLVVVALVPPLMGALVGGQRRGGRRFNRMLMSFVAIFALPVALAVLVRGFLGPIWYTSTRPTPSPFGDFASRLLTDPQNARVTLVVVDALITVAIAMAVGGAAFIAARRGKQITGRGAGLGVWLLGLTLVIATIPHTFDLAFTMTGGGPARATTTYALNIFIRALQNFNFGYGAALSVPLILVTMFGWLLAGSIASGFKLRLRPPRPYEYAEPQRGGGLGILGTLLIVLLGLPLVVLAVWGLWVAIGSNGFSELDRLELKGGQLLLTSLVIPAAVIWLIQIPLAYLAGMGLGLFRPLGRATAVLFVLMLMFSGLPTETLLVPWFNQIRESELVNSPIVLGLPWVMGGFSLLIFTLYFRGARENYLLARASGVPSAFTQTVLSPSVGLVLGVGLMLTLMSLAGVLWPMSSTFDASNQPLSTTVLRTIGLYGTQMNVPITVTVMLLWGGALLIGLPLVLVNGLAVDRLVLVGGMEGAFAPAPYPQFAGQYAPQGVPPYVPPYAPPYAPPYGGQYPPQGAPPYAAPYPGQYAPPYAGQYPPQGAPQPAPYGQAYPPQYPPQQPTPSFDFGSDLGDLPTYDALADQDTVEGFDDGGFDSGGDDGGGFSDD